MKFKATMATPPTNTYLPVAETKPSSVKLITKHYISMNDILAPSIDIQYDNDISI